MAKTTVVGARFDEDDRAKLEMVADLMHTSAAGLVAQIVRAAISRVPPDDPVVTEIRQLQRKQAALMHRLVSGGADALPPRTSRRRAA